MIGVPWPTMKMVMTRRTETAEKATTRSARRTRRSFRSSLFLPRFFVFIAMSRPSRSLDGKEAFLLDQGLTFRRQDEVDELLRQACRLAHAHEQERPDEIVAAAQDVLIVRRGAVEIERTDLLVDQAQGDECLLYTSPSPRDGLLYRMPSSA